MELVSNICKTISNFSYVQVRSVCCDVSVDRYNFACPVVPTMKKKFRYTMKAFGTWSLAFADLSASLLDVRHSPFWKIVMRRLLADHQLLRDLSSPTLNGTDLSKSRWNSRVSATWRSFQDLAATVVPLRQKSIYSH